MVLNNDQLVQAFKTKILGIRNYPSNKKEFNVTDFLTLEILEAFLDEVDTGESDITPAGKSFLEQYYGFKELSNLLVKRGKLTESIKDSSSERLCTWLENLEPMGISRFIETSRGTVNNTTSLKEDLLPPKDL